MLDPDLMTDIDDPRDGMALVTLAVLAIVFAAGFALGWLVAWL